MACYAGPGAATGNAAPAIGQAGEPLAAANMLQLTLTLLLVLALFFALAWLLRRFRPGQITAGGQMKVIAGLSVGARERILLVEVGETQLLIGVSPGRVQTLHVLDQPLDAGVAASSDGQGFAQRLQTALRQGGDS